MQRDHSQARRERSSWCVGQWAHTQRFSGFSESSCWRKLILQPLIPRTIQGAALCPSHCSILNPGPQLVDLLRDHYPLSPGGYFCTAEIGEGDGLVLPKYICPMMGPQGMLGTQKFDPVVCEEYVGRDLRQWQQGSTPPLEHFVHSFLMANTIS